MYPRLVAPQKSSFFLFGSRGCGKSTRLAGAYPGARVVDLLDEGRYQSYLADPSLFHHGLTGLPPGSGVAVDEIQRLPQLPNEVHRLIEGRCLRFVLTGSSARKPRRTGGAAPAGLPRARQADQARRDRDPSLQ